MSGTGRGKASEDRQRLERFFRDELGAAGAEAPAFDDVAAYVDGTLEASERERFEMRLADDPLLREEVRDLEELRGAMRVGRASVRRWVLPSSLAAGLLAATLWWARPAGEPTRLAGSAPPRAHSGGAPSVAIDLNDSGRQISLGADGRLTGLPDLPRGARESVTSALRLGTIGTPPILDSLRPKSVTFMGAPSAPAGLSVVSPVGTIVRSDSPVFRWTALAGARRYSVSIHDEDLVRVASSPDLEATEWKPPTPLRRGRTYLWQVVAITPETRIVAPQPPAPEARFHVLAAEEALALADAIRASSGSRLVAGVLLAQAGILEEAEAELAALAAANPRSAEARRLLEAARALGNTAASPASPLVERDVTPP